MNLIVSFLLLIGSVQAVTVRLQVQLDSAPQETAWEIRGPLPQPTLVDGVTYDYYQHENAMVEEILDLPAGDYWFLLSDIADNGISEGSYKIVAELTTGVTVLAEGNGDFSSSQISQFTIPQDQQMEMEVSSVGYFRGSR